MADPHVRLPQQGRHDVTDTAHSDPRDRANGPGAWPTLVRSIDMTNGTAPPQPTAKMTMRVYTVNRAGIVTEDRGLVGVLPSDQPAPLSTAFPPCQCPRCGAGRAVTR